MKSQLQKMENNFDDEVIGAEIGGNYVMCPQGNHPATCVALIILGTQMESYMGSTPSEKKKLMLGFEITGQKHVFKEGKPAEPFIIWVEYLQSLNKNSNLRKMIETWAGKNFTDKEIEGFNIKDLVGNTCLANVVKSTSNGKERTRIMSINKVPDGMTVPALINTPFVFNFRNPFDEVSFAKVPEWIQKKIRESSEYKQAVGAGIAGKTEVPTEANSSVPKKKLF